MSKFKLGLRLSPGRAFYIDLLFDYGHRQVVRGKIHVPPLGQVTVRASLSCPKYSGYQAHCAIPLNVHAQMSDAELAYMANMAIIQSQKRLDTFLRPARVSYYETILGCVRRAEKVNKFVRHVMDKDGRVVPYSIEGMIEYPGYLVVREDRIEIDHLPTASETDGVFDNEEDLPF